MAPRRRSSRLQSATPGKIHPFASNPLGSLAEGDETSTITVLTQRDSGTSPHVPRTPLTAGRLQPAREEMHPSMAHRSTTQEPDSGLRLGFTDIKNTGTNQPSGVYQQTPSKMGVSESAFDFRFARPGPQLGPEAQRMMDELRDEALRIKAKLAVKREEAKRNGVDDTVEGRKMAHPKGKVGRFSDVHMAAFKKMDSIAGHPSAARSQPARVTPVKNNLKRSPAKAHLDDKEDSHTKASNRTKSFQNENTAPAKRARKHVTDDTSSARPVSRDCNAPSTPNLKRSQLTFLSTITTPTYASLVRGSEKKPATQIPLLTRSMSKSNLHTTPRRLTRSASKENLARTPGSPSMTPYSPGKLEKVKSILRQAGSNVTKPPTNESAIPTLSFSPSKPSSQKPLPALPSTPNGIGSSKIIRQVNFTPDTIKKNAAGIPNSPSPVKSGIPHSSSRINLAPMTKVDFKSSAKFNNGEVKYPSLASLQNLNTSSHVEYPSLAGVRALEPAHDSVSHKRPPTSIPSTFTFRTDHTINFGPTRASFGSSPSQASVRQVLESRDKENHGPLLPSVPHGMSNKKRHRADSDDDRDGSVRVGKKSKSTAAEDVILMTPNLQTENVRDKKMVSPKKRCVLSLSRLNMLARPKVRK